MHDEHKHAVTESKEVAKKVILCCGLGFCLKIFQISYWKFFRMKDMNVVRMRKKFSWYLKF